jgi:ElaB/YqjD/DUF883 family membrane-anchored ribosome-binding protein
LAQTGSPEKDYDVLKADLAKLREDVARLVAALAAEQSEKAEGLRAKAGEKLHRAQQAGAEAVAQAGDMARDSVDAAERTVRDHPLASLLGAFGLGLVVAQLLSRR